jgi:hypothetical protein
MLGWVVSIYPIQAICIMFNTLAGRYILVTVKIRILVILGLNSALLL